ncbi:MAG TPA: bifunctional nuclease family protein [Anaeromyxobacteraceae bacterium]|nr:bifunctional nuclease family protein [Anaeromyxobacteraceae bacterium]
MRPPLALAAALALAIAPSAGVEGEMRPVRVAAVLPLAGNGALLLLEATDSGTLLPLVIGTFEATAIQEARTGARPPRPLTHDLLASTVAALGARVERVDVDAFEDSVYRAKLRLALPGRTVTLDARPSDSVALAVRTGAPIFVARRVLESQGLSREDLERLRRDPGALERHLGGGAAEGIRL